MLSFSHWVYCSAGPIYPVPSISKFSLGLLVVRVEIVKALLSMGVESIKLKYKTEELTAEPLIGQWQGTCCLPCGNQGSIPGHQVGSLTPYYCSKKKKAEAWRYTIGVVAI